jgi:hypothetical protein
VTVETSSEAFSPRARFCGVASCQIESELIYHRLERRVDAHILVAFLAYCLQVTLKNRLHIHAPGLTLSAVLEKLATIR